MTPDCDACHLLLPSHAFASPEADKYRDATIDELVAMWKAVKPLAMVSHPHAAYANALCATVKVLKMYEERVAVLGRRLRKHGLSNDT
jgi:hypothetical protein